MDLVVPRWMTLSSASLASCLQTPAAPGNCAIDLRFARFIDPVALVSIATLAEAARRRGDIVEFQGPKKEDPSKWSHRMGLGDALADLSIKHDLRAVMRWPTGDRLQELSRFEGDESADDLAERVHRIFVDKFPSTAAGLYKAIQEVAQNVLDHSSLGHGYVALQQYRVKDHHEVSFAIGDSGIGLRKRLSLNHVVSNDVHAVELAVQDGITSGGSIGNGAGLGGMLRAVRLHHGNAVLWSGAGRGAFDTEGRAVLKAVSPHPGTLLHVRLRVG